MTEVETVDKIPKTLSDLKAPYISVVNAVTGELVGIQEWDSPIHLTAFKAAFVAAMEQQNIAYEGHVRTLVKASVDVATKLGNKKIAIPESAAAGMVMTCVQRIEEALHRVATYQGGYGDQLAVVLPFAYVAKQDGDVVDFRRSKPLVNGLIFTGVFRDEIGADVSGKCTPCKCSNG